MIVLHLGRWCHASGHFFSLSRIYWRGQWTPFCRVKKRYGSWFGYRQTPPKRH